MAHAVLPHVQEDALAVVRDGPCSGIKFQQLVLQQFQFLLELVVVPLHAIKSNLGNQQVLRLRSALHTQAAFDELVDGELAALVVIKQVKNLLRIVDREVNHPELVVDLGFLDSHVDLLVGEGAAVVGVRVLEDGAQLVEHELPVAVLRLPHLVLVPGGSGECILHHDADDDVEQTEGDDADDNQEEDDHPRLVLDDVPGDAVAPLVQGNDLEEREERTRHCGKVDLVIPAGLPEVRVVDAIVVPDPERREDAGDVADDEDHDAHPQQGLHSVDQAIRNQPQLLEYLEEAHQSHQTQQSHEAQHGDKPGIASGAQRLQHESVQDGSDHDEEVQDVGQLDARGQVEQPLPDAVNQRRGRRALARLVAGGPRHRQREESKAMKIQAEADLHQEKEAKHHLEDVPNDRRFLAAAADVDLQADRNCVGRNDATDDHVEQAPIDERFVPAVELVIGIGILRILLLPVGVHQSIDIIALHPG
mmetsp:Transcript_125197/g.401031  ORF Transcript_125197/g.401031 Transcript_125197/m.401031 type:complete len:476 (+) Transcript_125197:469-1896(+)